MPGLAPVPSPSSASAPRVEAGRFFRAARAQQPPLGVAEYARSGDRFRPQVDPATFRGVLAALELDEEENERLAGSVFVWGRAGVLVWLGWPEDEAVEAEVRREEEEDWEIDQSFVTEEEEALVGKGEGEGQNDDDGGKEGEEVYVEEAVKVTWGLATIFEETEEEEEEMDEQEKDEEGQENEGNKYGIVEVGMEVGGEEDEKQDEEEETVARQATPVVPVPVPEPTRPAPPIPRRRRRDIFRRNWLAGLFRPKKD
ncbi:hypothetical protein V8F20_010135 [Naviculisporaceae sp. PSN 640]